jgi:hypothetical protein
MVAYVLLVQLTRTLENFYYDCDMQDDPLSDAIKQRILRGIEQKCPRGPCLCGMPCQRFSDCGCLCNNADRALYDDPMPYEHGVFVDY